MLKHRSSILSSKSFNELKFNEIENVFCDKRMFMKKEPIVKNVVILTSSKHGKPFIGDEKFFRKLITQLNNEESEGFVFPFSFNQRELAAYKWQTSTATWIKTTCPKPSVVYNRFPYRELENNKRVQDYFQFLKEENIPYFNASFFHKEKVARLLQKRNKIRNYFPTTVPYTNDLALKHFIAKHRVVFLKDVHGSQGNGIWKITYNKNDDYTLYSQRKTFPHLTEKKLMYMLTPLLKKRQIIIQKGISLNKVDKLKYDFRILMHYLNNRWKLIGYAPRVAKENGLTTHVPKGGKLLPIKEVPFTPTEEEVEDLGKLIGETLQKHFDNVQEFSFDLGLDEEKHPWIFDVNSKPMIFDELEIQNKSIQSLATMLLNAKM